MTDLESHGATCDMISIGVESFSGVLNRAGAGTPIELAVYAVAAPAAAVTSYNVTKYMTKKRQGTFPLPQPAIFRSSNHTSNRKGNTRLSGSINSNCELQSPT